MVTDGFTQYFRQAFRKPMKRARRFPMVMVVIASSIACSDPLAPALAWQGEVNAIELFDNGGRLLIGRASTNCGIWIAYGPGVEIQNRKGSTVDASQLLVGSYVRTYVTGRAIAMESCPAQGSNVTRIVVQ